MVTRKPLPDPNETVLSCILRLGFVLQNTNGQVEDPVLETPNETVKRFTVLPPTQQFANIFVHGTSHQNQAGWLEVPVCLYHDGREKVSSASDL